MKILRALTILGDIGIVIFLVNALIDESNSGYSTAGSMFIIVVVFLLIIPNLYFVIFGKEGGKLDWAFSSAEST
ncbi:MAG: hypothetical protein HY432_02785 [Candidatus Liptonbacteria bacterium]|nr:hypothetical protein [Candidatus Liptonbacteria bacterium]